MNLSPWLLVGLAALPSCGGRATGASGSDSGPLPSEDAATTPSADVYAPCSSSPPADGRPCTSPGLECELGTSPFLVCDTCATCGNGVWTFEDAVPSLCAT